MKESDKESDKAVMSLSKGHRSKVLRSFTSVKVAIQCKNTQSQENLAFKYYELLLHF